MKRLFIIVLILLCTSCTARHSWMDKAFVGYVDNQAVVLFDAGIRNSIQYYRPQFQSDCHYNKVYIDEQSSTGCVISEKRITKIHSYRNHTNQITEKTDKTITLSDTNIQDHL